MGSSGVRRSQHPVGSQCNDIEVEISTLKAADPKLSKCRIFKGEKDLKNIMLLGSGGYRFLPCLSSRELLLPEKLGITPIRFRPRFKCAAYCIGSVMHRKLYVLLGNMENIDPLTKIIFDFMRTTRRTI
uniref:Uncharacterized protein n=1 Tax=Glossina pallidipes TaxID=7398 RepID=A0A1A9Z790_GLOPL